LPVSSERDSIASDSVRSLVESAWRDHDGDARETAQALLGRR